MKKLSTLFILLCVLLIVSNFFIISCPDDDDEVNTITPTATPTITQTNTPNNTPTNTPTTIPQNDIFHFSAAEESGSTVYVTVDYYYTSDHGSAWMGSWPLDENGDYLNAGFVPESIHSGYGSVTIKVHYLDESPYTSNEIAVFMYTPDITFYREVFPYEKTWTPD